MDVLSDAGPVPGVLGKKPLWHFPEDERQKVFSIEQMRIDIGARHRAHAASLVSIGDAVAVLGVVRQLAGGRLVAPALDNRLGTYVALEVGRRVAESAVGGFSLAVVGTGQEELTLAAAQTISNRLMPDVAIVVDVWHATDAHLMTHGLLGDHRLGSGPVIGRGPVVDPQVSQMLLEVACEQPIPHTVAALGKHSGTDADQVFRAGGGISTGVVSIPLRYMHSPVEMADLSDVDGATELVVGFVESWASANAAGENR